MDKVAMIKQAYAYGVSVALQEIGYDARTAQDAGIKLAEDEEGMHPALKALLGAGIGAGGGALGGAALGAGGAALAQKLSPTRTGRLTSLLGGRGFVPESLQGIPQGTSAISNAQVMKNLQREALLGGELGGAGGAGLGAIGGGLYGGLSE